MSAQQVFSTEFPLMWEWGQSISFVVATGSTQNMPICHALNLAWGRTLPRLFLVAKSFIIPPPPQKTCTHSLSLSLTYISGSSPFLQRGSRSQRLPAVAGGGDTARGSEGQARGHQHEPPLQRCGQPCQAL